jgi:acetolactate synthase regulatory subunit
MNMTKQLNRWQIECAHTPESIDRVLMPIRKRGLSVESFTYQKKDENTAICTIEFEMEGADLERVYKNMLRIYDIQTVTKLA